MSISNFNAYALSRSEMKRIAGGCGVTANCTCQTKNKKGYYTTFSGTFWTASDHQFYASKYCPNSGSVVGYLCSNEKGSYCK
jgi:hypothetical protein